MRPITDVMFDTHQSLKYSMLVAFALCIVGLASTAAANPADLDPTFGNGGKVISSPDGTNRHWADSMALQADGKIVMAGGGGSPASFVVARYNPDGSLDTDFGTNGFTLIHFSDPSRAVDVALQPDGKIVVAGDYANPTMGGSANLCVARLNSDGSPDMTFDGDGKLAVLFPSLPGYSKFLSAMAIANDGKIVLAGHALLSATDDRFVLARLNADGSFDGTFGNSGLFVGASNGSSHTNSLADIVVLADGTIVAAGFSSSVSSNHRIVKKYDSSGTGTVWTYSEGTVGGFPGFAHGFFGIAPLPDGKFIVVGKRASRIYAARINEDGTLDNTFIDAPGMPLGEAISVAIQADGKIVANYKVTGTSNFSLIRYNANGSVDTGFGGGGFSSQTVISPTADFGRKVIVQPDGKILVGGYARPDATQYNFALVRYRGGNLIPDKTPFDYDGDNKSDVSVYRASNGTWYLDQSMNGPLAVQFGNSTDRIVPSDYDGDGKADISIYRDGQWWMLHSSNSVVRVVTFGIAEDKPQPGDFDGDGLDDQAVFRPSTGVWYVLRSTDGGYHSVPFGLSSDIPQRGDYDDDGKADIAVWRPSTSTWYIQKSTGGYQTTQFGSSGDIPVAADYDGDSKPDIAVWRPSNAVWYIMRSSSNQVDSVWFGISTDVPVPADYDGDGKVDISVFRPSTAVWYQIRSTSGTWASQVFGVSTDRPTPSAYNP